MQLTDDETYAVCKLGYQLYTRDRLDEAAEIFDGLVALDDTLGYPWHALGLIARRRGDAPRAIDCFQRRLELDPRAADSRVALAETLFEHGYRTDAAELLRHFRRADDESAAARRGRVLLDRWESEGVLPP